MNLQQLKTPTSISILITNLLLLIAVFIFKWDSLSVFALYIIETIIIGIFHIFKLITLSVITKLNIYKVNGAPGFTGLIGFILFFIFHFGLFVFVQTVLILPGNGGFLQTFLSLRNYINDETIIFLYGILAINFFALINYLFFNTEFEEKTFNEVLLEPYPRIIIQQFVVILGSGILAIIGSKLIFTFLFIGIKTSIELAVSVLKKFVKSEEKKY